MNIMNDFQANQILKNIQGGGLGLYFAFLMYNIFLYELYYQHKTIKCKVELKNVHECHDCGLDDMMMMMMMMMKNIYNATKALHF